MRLHAVVFLLLPVSVLLPYRIAENGSIVTIKGLTATSTRLVCDEKTASTSVTVELLVTGPIDRADKFATVSLNGYITNLPSNSLEIDQVVKKVSLRSLPALVKYKIACSPGTISGSETFAAAILRASDGLSFDVGPSKFVEIQTVGKPTSQHPEHRPQVKRPQS